MSIPAAERPANVLCLPPELLEQIFSHVPYEHVRDVLQLQRHWRDDYVPRSFKPQLTFAHVCRVWRNVAHASQYWPGVRLNLYDIERFKEGIAHGHGDALLHVHIDPNHIYALDPERREWAPMLALKQLPRIRTLFLQLKNQDFSPTIGDVTAYTRALGDLAAPELQDFTFEWWADRMKEPCPRLRYLTLSFCDLTTRQTVLHSDNLVRIDLRSVHVFNDIDELVDTVSRWRHLQCLNLERCQIISPNGRVVLSKRSAVHLPELRELLISDIAANVSAFLKHVTFPPTTTADLVFYGPDATPESVVLQTRDAIRHHFDSPEGRSLISSAYGFTITYPLGYGIQFRAPEKRKPGGFWMDVSDDYYLNPQADFSFRQGTSDNASFEESLLAIPSLETVPRLDLSGQTLPVLTPPPSILRRFVGTTHLALNEDRLQLLDDIAEDTQLFPQLECIELVAVSLLNEPKEIVILHALQDARDDRPSLIRLLLRKCSVRDETFARAVFGEGNVQMIESD
ncbi:unnamed protein product [Peniophora sp. CBMAI 1063]|nr:unnamed protein product [Peniophora sp. CBMAI 1063]